MRAIALAVALTIGFHIDVKAQPLSAREVIALTLLAEARGEGTIGMTAVACVIANRVVERNLPARAVCLQPKQFSAWNDGVSVKLLRAPEAAEAFRIADLVLAGELVDITNGSNHYCRFDCHPSWADPAHMTMRLKNHCFYSL